MFVFEIICSWEIPVSSSWHDPFSMTGYLPWKWATSPPYLAKYTVQKWHVYIQKFVKFIIKVYHFFSLFGKVHPHPYCFLGRITNNVLLQNTLSSVLSIFQHAHVFIGHFLEKIFLIHGLIPHVIIFLSWYLIISNSGMW